MIAQTRSLVNDNSVNDAKESALTSYVVVHAANGHPDVNLRLHGCNEACVVHLPEDLVQLRILGLDLSEGTHGDMKSLIVAYREKDGRLTFLGIRSERRLPTVRIPGEERVGKLIAIKPTDYLGRPALEIKVAGEARTAEATGPQLGDMREQGLTWHTLKLNTWADAPTGWLVRYIAAKNSPNLDFVALEREAVAAPPSTPTDGDPMLAALLRGEEVAIEISGPARPASKDRRHARQLPKQQVGTNTFKFTSELLVQLPQPQRHEVMRGIDRLLAKDILPYLHGKSDVGTMRESLHRLEDQLMTIKGAVSKARKLTESAAITAANAVRRDPTVYERQAAEAYRERATLLKKIVKDWLGLDVQPEGGEASLKEDGAQVCFFLSGYSSAPSLQITLSSPLLPKPIRKSIFMHERAEEVYSAMWKAYDEAVESALKSTLGRETRKEKRMPSFPLDRPQYVRQ